MAKRGAPLDDSGALFLCFSRKNKEKSLKTGKRNVCVHRKNNLIPCSSQIMRKFAAICNAHFAKWRIL